MTKVLVTGGAGFIGSYLVQWLVGEGADVFVLDDMTTGTRENLDQCSRLEPRRIIFSSVTDREMVNKLVSQVEVVFHLAAQNIVASTRNPGADYATNIGGTLNVLMAAREFDIKRVVYASSASVYGNPRHLPACEDDPVCLLTPYAVSKFAGEGYCRAFFESYGVPTVALRYSNVYGPRQRGEGVVMRFARAVREGKPLPIHGDGQQTRDFTWVGDAVEATLLAAQSERAVGETFNVGTGVETSVIELGRLVAGPEAKLERVDRRDIDNIWRRVLNIEKARRVLRWIPTVTLEEGLELLRKREN
jgi:UDP-glucose 4-epimerase